MKNELPHISAFSKGWSLTMANNEAYNNVWKSDLIYI